MNQHCDVCDKYVPLSSFLKHIQKHGSGGNKFGAKKAEADGYVFDSTLERDRYLQLKMLSDAGVIRDLELQPKFMCVVNGKRVTTYTADFRYYDITHGVVIEDTKGRRTETYVVRKKLAEALFGIKIVEVTKDMM